MTRRSMRMRSVMGLVFLVAAAAGTISCGDVVRLSQSPMMLVVGSLSAGTANTNTFNSDVISSSGSVTDDVGSASLTVIQKDVTAPVSTNNDVTITRYHVVYRRADGRSTPGVDVPFPFDGAATVTIPANTSGSVTFELVRHVAKKETPLVQLVNDVNVLSAIADVTFYGQDQVGNELSATGSILINFLNLGD